MSFAPVVQPGAHVELPRCRHDQHPVMRFEWDRKMAESNFAKHAVSFDEAATIFFDMLSGTIPDPDHSIGERRFITMGMSSKGRLLVVAHVERASAVRIISARPASASERKRYEA